MRNIINISLPQSLSAIVRRKVQKGKFASTSEFFRDLLRKYLIIEELERRSKEMDNGRGILLKSLRALR